MGISAINLVQNYIVEPEGTAYKELLYDKIIADPLAVKLLNEQTLVMEKLQTLETPDLTDIFTEIKTDFDAKKLDYISQNFNTLKNKLFFGTISIVLVSLAVIFYSIISVRNISNNISTSKYNSISDKSPKIEYIQKRWLDGYSSITLDEISELLPSEEVYMNDLAKNTERIVNLGYLGDIKKYHSISDTVISMFSDNLLNTAYNELLSGSKTAIDVASTLEQASVASHKVLGIDIDEEAQDE